MRPAAQGATSNQAFLSSLKDEARGFGSGLMTREEMDERFGVGQWRPIPRFVLRQSDKLRMIDDGRRGGQNAAASLSETIRCIGVDFVPQVASVLVEEVQVPYEAEGWDTTWLALLFSCDPQTAVE